MDIERARLIQGALARASQLWEYLVQEPDPVEQRRAQALAAQELRRAANWLDDYGRLTP